MSRIDVHNHFLPAIDDGCRDVKEALECLRVMTYHGYSKLFCTPHAGATEFNDLTCKDVAEAVSSLRKAIAEAKIPIEIRPGGELRLTPDLCEHLKECGVPTYGQSNQYCLVDIWENRWPDWADRAVEWLRGKGLTVILAHPERMPPVRDDPAFIDRLAKVGLLFQGNLGPIAQLDAPDINALAERFLKDGRYFILGSDGHRISHLANRLNGLQKAIEFVGKPSIDQLTVINTGKLWA